MTLTDIRQRCGLSQAELGRRAKISRSDICQLEKGRKHLHPGWAIRIAEALNTTPEEITKAFFSGKS